MNRDKELEVALELLKRNFNANMSVEECDKLVNNIICSVNSIFDYYE